MAFLSSLIVLPFQRLFTAIILRGTHERGWCLGLVLEKPRYTAIATDLNPHSRECLIPEELFFKDSKEFLLLRAWFREVSLFKKRANVGASFKAEFSARVD